MKRLDQYPIRAAPKPLENGKRAIAIDVDRIKALILLYEDPTEFEKYVDPGAFTAEVAASMIPVIWRYLHERVQDERSPHFSVAYFGLERLDGVSVRAMLDAFHKQSDVTSWHCVSQSRTARFPRKDGTLSRVFDFKLVITMAVAPDEKRTTVFLNGSDVEQVVLLPKDR